LARGESQSACEKETGGREARQCYLLSSHNVLLLQLWFTSDRPMRLVR
jgi:hypothetical protein